MALNPQTIKQYYVFLASPGDVNDERKMVREFFESYNRHTAQLWGVRFEVVDWENYASIGVGRPQEIITQQTLERFKDSLALVIGLMAQRFGTATGKADSGTEEEFRWALGSYQENGFPEIKWFFRRVGQFVAPPAPDAIAESVDQWTRVCAFRNELTRLNVFFAEYPDAPGFRDIFGNDLNRWLADRTRPWVFTTPPEGNQLLPAFSPPRPYYEAIDRDFNRLDIAGIDNDRAFEIPLSEIYVRLRVIFDEGAGNDSDEVRDSGPIDVQTALLRYSKLVIVGDPGSGKSTFLKYVALMLAKSFLEKNASIALEKLCLQEPLPIPIFVSCWDLSDFLKSRSSTQLTVLLEFLAERLATYGFAIQPKDFEILLSNGNCCLLFDGLDEVPTDSGRAVVSRLLEDCVKNFSKNRYVVTSRIRAYTGDTILKGEFNRCDIQPLDASDRAKFLKNWIGLLFKVTPEQVLIEGTPPHREFESITESIETNDRIRPLAVNPLLLTVIAIVHWNRKRLPEQRVELYDECIDVLLGQRKEAEHVRFGRKNGTFDEQHELEQREERAWVRKRFAEIALHILSAEGNRDEATRSELVKLLASRFVDRGASSQERAEVHATYFLERQELQSGLLVSRREQSYRFVHLTFQEFLAAWHLANQEFDQVEPIIQVRLRQQRWFETLQLLGGEWAKQSDEKLDRYLAWLLDRQGKSIAERAPVIALCANIVRDTTGVAELTSQTRKKFRAGIEATLDAFRPGSGIPAITQLEILEALGQLGAAVKPHLIQATKSGLFQVRRRAIEMLLPHLSEDDLFQMDHILEDRSKEPIKTYLLSLFGRDVPRTAGFLQTRKYFSEKATEAFTEICYSLKLTFGYSNVVEIAENVFHRGNSLYDNPYVDGAYSSRGRLLSFIGDRDLIRKAAATDREAGVRRYALQELARPQSIGPQDWLVIRTAATGEENAGVRSGALKLLVRRQENASEIWSLIRDAITKEKNVIVRTTALELLGEQQKDVPETWSFVRELAIKDEEASVRAKALVLIVTHSDLDALEVKKLVPEVMFSIKEGFLRRQILREIDAETTIVSNPIMKFLLYGSMHPFGNGSVFDIDPLEPVTTAQIKKVSSWLGRNGAEIRKLYEEIADMVYVKLGLELTLEWKRPSRP